MKLKPTMLLLVLLPVFSKAESFPPTDFPPGTASPEILVWDGTQRIESTFLGHELRFSDVFTGARGRLQAPPEALGLTLWNGMATTLRMKEGNIVLSRRFPDGLWQDYATSLDGAKGPDGVQGVPLTLDESDVPHLYFAMNVVPGFTDGREAAPCAWWKQDDEGRLHPEALVPIELEGAVFRPVPVGRTFWAHLEPRYRGLAPFLEHPVRVKGAFLVVSMHAGILWVIKDGNPLPSQAIKLVSLDAARLAGRVPHDSVLLGLQPMPNGHVLIAMRSEQAVLDPPGSVAHPQILWKDLDPLEGVLADADSDLVAKAPTVLEENGTIAFTLDEEGRLFMMGERKHTTSPMPVSPRPIAAR